MSTHSGRTLAAVSSASAATHRDRARDARAGSASLWAERPGERQGTICGRTGTASGQVRLQRRIEEAHEVVGHRSRASGAVGVRQKASVRVA